MDAPTTADYLKYANLQMAAEAFLVSDADVPKTGTDYVDALTVGNDHASRFTQTCEPKGSESFDFLST